MKKLFIITVLTAALILFGGAWLDAAEKTGGSFRFAYMYRDGTAVGTQDKSPGPLKLFFQSLNSAYPYVLLYSSSGELTLLAPSEAGGFSKEHTAKKIFLSSQKEWFSGGPGVYSLFVVVGDKRLTHFEKYLKELRSGGKEREAVEKILAGIRRMRRENELLSNIHELPAPIVGTIRNEQVFWEEELVKLDFVEEENPGESPSPVSGFSETVISRLEQGASVIDFNGVYVMEIVLEYDGK